MPAKSEPPSERELDAMEKRIKALQEESESSRKAVQKDIDALDEFLKTVNGIEEAA